jgi:hypothetical protein
MTEHAARFLPLLGVSGIGISGWVAHRYKCILLSEDGFAQITELSLIIFGAAMQPNHEVI